LRLQDKDGVESDVVMFTSENQCRAMRHRIQRAKLTDDAASALLLMLIAIEPLAQRIKAADDQQGQAGYATKAHMRAWAEEIVDNVKFALGMCGLNAPQEAECNAANGEKSLINQSLSDAV
jgi:hypothetical protein